MKTPIRFVPRALPSARLCAQCTRVAICIGRDTGFDMRSVNTPCTACGTGNEIARPFAPYFDAPKLASIAARARVNRAISDAQFRVFLALHGAPCELRATDARTVLNAARIANERARTLASEKFVSLATLRAIVAARASAVVVKRAVLPTT
jgi:hypothetical protein